MSEGVEQYDLTDTDNFDISEKITRFNKSGGQILACGTCLEIRGGKDKAACPISTMADLIKLVEESDKVLVFG